MSGNRPDDDTGTDDPLARFFGPLARAWYGQAPLGPVFWTGGVLLSSVLIAMYGVALAAEMIVLEQILILAFAPYTLWILVSIWRCSAPGDTFWSLFARYLTMAWSMNSGMVLLFLQLDLLATYLGYPSGR